MPDAINRKQFLQRSTTAALGFGLASAGITTASPTDGKTVNVGLIGCGNRGRSLLTVMAGMPDVAFPALCDIDSANADRAAEIVASSGRVKPKVYVDGPEAFRQLLERGDIDAVVIATPWHWHTPIAVAALEAGKYAGVEVPAALTIDECWRLVDTSEKTGVPCMMLENWSFRRDNLAVLNMIRLGLLGEMVHCHCAHSHDCIDHWFFKPDGQITWGGDYLLWRNADQYPTHSLGPVLSWLDIGCGDYFDYVTSTATSSRGINAYFTRKFGADHPNARRKYAQGDIVTSVLRTKRGRTVVVNYDMQLPRPYDNRWTIQGTLGIYNEQRDSVYLTGVSPEYHEWEPFGPYQEQHEHSWWREMNANPPADGHGGTDYLELRKFLDAVRAGGQTPIDVYDSVAMSALVALSEKSIATGSAPVEFPDFTRGQWRVRQPSFALES